MPLRGYTSYVDLTYPSPQEERSIQKALVKGKMKEHLEKIRNPNTALSRQTKALVTIGIAFFGFALGIFQKWLDSVAVNELPLLFQQLDITNYFGRLAIWIFLGTVIAVYSSSPTRAGINAFLFFFSMVTGYYLYCRFILGFLPTTYMLIWIAVSLASFFLAYICWYAKGKGAVALAISAGILGVLLAQAFLFVRGFGVTHLTEIITWLLALIVLRRRLKEYMLVCGISLVVAVIYQLLFSYWG